MERLKEPVAEAEGSRARGPRWFSARNRDQRVANARRPGCGPAICTRVNGLAFAKRHRGVSSPLTRDRKSWGTMG
jgi:hypothetical protein